MFAHLGTAGEADFADARVGADCLAKRGAGPGDARDGFRRKTGLEQNLHQFKRRQRGVGRRLEQHGVAALDGEACDLNHCVWASFENDPEFKKATEIRDQAVKVVTITGKSIYSE